MKRMGLVAAVLAMLVVCATGIALGAQENPATGDVSSEVSSASPTNEPGIELKAERTATSETFRLPSGALQTRLYESPVNYRDADGEWRSIKEGFEPSTETALSNAENGFDVSLPARMGEGTVRLRTEGEWVAYELLGPSSEPVQLEGDTATYEAVGDDVVYELSSLATGLKENIVIADASQPSVFTFELSASPGVVPNLTASGEVEFRDQTDELVVVLPAPIMSDSSSTPLGISHEAHYKLEPQGQDRWHLLIEADEEWISHPDRQFPVRLDPTLSVPSPSLDCMFRGAKGKAGWRACGSSGHQELFAGEWPALKDGQVSEWARSALRFDLSPLPSGPKYIAGATLGLHSPVVATNTSGVGVWRATKSWTNQVNWLTYNGTNAWATEGGDLTDEGATISTSERGSQAGWWNFSDELAALVGKWVSGEASNQGLLVRLADDKSSCVPPSCQERSVWFNSSAASNASLRPYLAVTYYLPAPTSSKVVSPSEGTRCKSQQRCSARRAEPRATCG